MKIKFCGAAGGEVTGSSHLIILDSGFSILLDCGLYQGDSEAWKNFNEQWLFDPKDIDCMILSHAHIDHTGKIPKLCKDGFDGAIFTTHATKELCGLMLMDSAYIQENEASNFNRRHQYSATDKKAKKPLYDANDAKKTMSQFVSVAYDRPFKISEEVEILLLDSGHMLGSASVTLTIKENGIVKKIGFSGDIGRPNRPILRDPQPMPPVDVLICESTYGDKEHESAPNEFERFARIIFDTCHRKKGKILIPAFSIGRTQEIVFMLDKLAHHNLLPRVPVYIDSPLAINATEVFRHNLDCFDEELHEYMLKDKDPFGFNSLQYVSDVEQSKALNFSKEPCVIIASSGMMNTGRIKHHLANNIENENNTILIVGYCSPNTPGGMLRNGAKKLYLFGQEKKVKATVEVMDSFSAHADRKEIFDFIAHQQNNLKKIWLVHGDFEAQTAFKEYLTTNGFQNTDIILPKLGEEFIY
jgi:metallo-beta-lactamase family protein